MNVFSFSLHGSDAHVLDRYGRLQHWYKDMRRSTRVKDEEGYPAFALVNKATGLAIKHSLGQSHPVDLVPYEYDPAVMDLSVLWTQSKDVGDGFRCIRMVTNIYLNFDAFEGDPELQDGTVVGLWEWNEGGNQCWKILPWDTDANAESESYKDDEYGGDDDAAPQDRRQGYDDGGLPPALSSESTVRIFCSAGEEYSVAARDGAVCLVPTDPSDDLQHWVKDMRRSTRIKDEDGYPAFALVNKLTGEAIKHSLGETHPVRLVRYDPDYLDESVLWTESQDVGDGFRCVRMVNNIHLNFDALDAGEGQGGVHDGTAIVLWEWLSCGATLAAEGGRQAGGGGPRGRVQVGGSVSSGGRAVGGAAAEGALGRGRAGAAGREQGGGQAGAQRGGGVAAGRRRAATGRRHEVVGAEAEAEARTGQFSETTAQFQKSFGAEAVDNLFGFIDGSFHAAMVTHSNSKGDGMDSQEKKFIDIVDTVLRNHDGTYLDQFEVAFELREKHACSLDSWIGFAVSSKASEIVLDLDPRSPRTAEDAYDFPFHLFQSENGIQSVWVKCVSLKPPRDFYGFTKLTKFTISELSTALPCLEELYMDVRLKAEVRDYAISKVKFNYLRYVNCTVIIRGHPKYTGGILELASIVKAAPVLEKLDLHMDSSMYPHYICKAIGNPSPSPHNHLKIVRATGFFGLEGQIELALYILENARLLQSMTIDLLALRQSRRSREEANKSIDAQICREIVHEFLGLEKYRGVLTIL
ncbi:hypothetical protein D1007_29049 [Hordeum vulgare]|nr:hypothetical protein D1007_29049 [Hordeum vulgare]